jgi:hypothetical protein
MKIKKWFMRRMYVQRPARQIAACFLALALGAAWNAGAQTASFGLQWVGTGAPISDTNGAFGVPLADWQSLNGASGSMTLASPTGGGFTVTWATGGGQYGPAADVTFVGLTAGDDEVLSGCLYAEQNDTFCGGPISVTITGMNSVATGTYAISLGAAINGSAANYTFQLATVTDANNDSYTLNFTAPVLVGSVDTSIASTTTNLTLSGDSIAFTICNDEFPGTLRAELSEMTVQYTPASAPVITRQPQSQTVPEGSNVTFSVIATGNPGPLTYSWSFDGTALGQTNATLTLTGVSDASSGIYQVTVTDAGGHFSLSSPATLVVAPAGPLVLFDASTMTGYGNTGTYSPGIANYFSVGTGTAVTLDQLGFDSTTNVLVGTVTVQLWDAIAGQVLATVAFGSSDSSTPVGTPTAYLYLKAPTNAITLGAGTYAIAQYGGTYCNVPTGETINTGNGAIAVVKSCYWGGSGNGGPGNLPSTLDGAPYPHYLGPTLQFTVSTGPAITQQPVGGAFSPGSTVTLSVTAGGSLPLSYLWKKNGNSTGVTSPSLTLVNITANSSGTYTVLVSNSGGSVNSSPAIVTVAQAPVLSIQLNPGIVIEGTVGADYQVQYSTALAPGVWILLQNIPALPTSPYAVYDPTPVSAGERFYRALIGP